MKVWSWAYEAESKGELGNLGINELSVLDILGWMVNEGKIGKEEPFEEAWKRTAAE